MLDIRTILAPTDFSPRSERAAAHAASLARHFRARLVFVHVVAHPPREYQLLGAGRSMESEPALAAQARAALNDWVVRQGLDGEPEAVLELGDPAHRIALLAAERKADLLVTATQGRGPFRRLLLGSVAAKLLHDVECPVMTGAHMEEEPASFAVQPHRRIVCALSLRDMDHSQRVLAWAWDFARSWTADLHIVHVPPSIEWSAGEWFPDETQQLVREASRERLQDLIGRVGCRAEVHLEGVDPIEYSKKVIERVGADVLIIGRRGAVGLLGSGSSGLAMIRESLCPVIGV